jgi:hypothetical protein
MHRWKIGPQSSMEILSEKLKPQVEALVTLLTSSFMRSALLFLCLSHHGTEFGCMKAGHMVPFDQPAAARDLFAR